MGADRSRIPKVVPLSSLSNPQRLIVTALLDAARAADAKAADEKKASRASR